MKNIYMIGNTHFDPVWLWKWDEAMASIHSTFRSALERMKEDKDFIYSFATPPVFEWIKEVDPDMFEEIKQRVKEGRWELCEAWWLQPDCFTASGESYARQSLYGQRYLKENFGIYSNTVFNVDSFGHNSATPQILKKSHVDYYCLCRPENRHIELESPYFKWVGNDGSSVKAFRTGEYSEIYNKDMRSTVEKTEENMKDATCDELMLFGVTNHGGAPTKKAISDIHELNEEKDYQLKFSTVSGYFEAQDEPTAVHNGELITGDFGPYTNNYLIKKRNRIAEYSVLNAEKASILAKKLLDKEYPKAELDSCWRDIMFNQFHDILGGASIKDAYFDAYNQQGRAISTANEITHYALQRITRKIKMVGSNPENPWNIVVWNLNDTDYNGCIEAEIQWLHEFPAYSGGIMLEDDNGKQYPCQIILEKSVIEGFRSRFLFEAEIPAFGYKTFKVIQTNENVKLVQNDKFDVISTDKFEIVIDNGIIDSITRKDSGKTYKGLVKPVVFEDEGDTWCFNVEGYGKELEKPLLQNIKVTESGDLRTIIKADFSFRNSLITLYYIFYNNQDYFDIKYSVNWNEKHTVLKLAIDSGYNDLISSAPFSAENRKDTIADVPMGEWLTLFDKDSALSIFANSAFSYSKDKTTLYLSLLRSSIYGDLRIAPLNDYDYPYQEQGVCEGDLRFMLHNSLYTDKIPQNAAAFNNPVIVICEANHDGIFSSTNSDISLDTDSVVISAIKECEDDESVIVRLYESLGRKTSATLKLFNETFSFDFKPFEIKTIKISKTNTQEVYITED